MAHDKHHSDRMTKCLEPRKRFFNHENAALDKEDLSFLVELMQAEYDQRERAMNDYRDYYELDPDNGLVEALELPLYLEECRYAEILLQKLKRLLDAELARRQE
ncbi:MAG: hypothetical protein C4523_18700 [Myxococcales bacterium]|nr:MAG: hypothetical protein C4523_18700 [Myxococcales bacterium]